MKSILLEDKIPYLLTILFGLVAYQLEQLASFYLEAPTLVRYDEITAENQTALGFERIHEITILNVTRDKVFRDLDFTLAFKSKVSGRKELSEFSIIPVAPSQIEPNDRIEEAGSLITFAISEIQPQTSYVLAFKSVLTQKVADLPEIYISSPNTIRLTNPTFGVWITRNQFGIHFGLLIVWVLLIILYFIKLSHSSNS